MSTPLESDTLITSLFQLGRRRAPRGLAERILATVRAIDQYVEVNSEVGPVFIAFGAQGITAVAAARLHPRAEFETSYAAQFGRGVERVPHPPAALARALGDRLTRQGAGRLRFDLSSLTDFQRDVLLKTLEIPLGEVRPYGWIAREIGRPAAVRAVGSALGANPIPYLIPCHRVVRTDGIIGEYGAGGPEAKKAVLRLEGVDPDWLEERARRHARYTGSSNTRIFCFPTCRHARRIGEASRVWFGDEGAASAAGYRPCRSCRPAPVAA